MQASAYILKQVRGPMVPASLPDQYAARRSEGSKIGVA